MNFFLPSLSFERLYASAEAPREEVLFFSSLVERMFSRRRR